MRYYIYRGQKGLSGFYPNDIKGVFAFRRNDFISFNNEQEAKNFLVIVNKEVNNKENQNRYGEKYGKLNSSIAKNLYISNKSPFY